MQKRVYNVNFGTEPATTPTRRRIDGCLGVGGTAWLTCLPTSRFTELDDVTFRAAARLRLGLQPIGVPTEACPAFGAKRRCAVIMKDCPSHLMSCNFLMHRDGASTVRHSLVGDAIAHHLAAAGVLVVPELVVGEAGGHGGGALRVDFALWDADQKETLTDHTIYDPCKASAVGSLQALENWAAREKQRKYDDVVTELQQRDHRITFVPMVFSALGRFAPAALDILRLKTVRANPDKVRRWPTGQAGLINATINAVSCAIQRGNVQMLLMAANEVHRILRGDARRAGEPAV